MFIVSAFLLLIVLIEKTLACEPKCKPNNTCVAKAQSNLTLECNSYHWYKLTRMIASPQNGIENKEHYSYCGISFTILNLNSSDSGLSIYKATNGTENSFICEFNLFIYDSENKNAYLTINNMTHELNNSTNEEFELKIDSFNEPVEYSFSIESLPIHGLQTDGRLLFNNQTTKCSSQLKYPWLNCLESNKLKIDLKKCQPDLKLNLKSYVENLTIYEGNFKLVEFNPHIKLIFPPKAGQNEDIFYNGSTESITLNCTPECALNKENLTYKWTIKRKDNLNAWNLLIEDKHDYYVLNKSEVFDKIDSISCEIIDPQVNFTNLSFKSESVKMFYLKNETNTSTVTTATSTTTTTRKNYSNKVQHDLVVFLVVLLISLFSNS